MMVSTAAAATPTAAVAPSDSPDYLPGRQTERRQLERLVHQARHGQGRPLLVLGDAGMGKSALLHHWQQHTPRTEASFLWLDGLMLEAPDSLTPRLLQALVQLANQKQNQLLQDLQTLGEPLGIFWKPTDLHDMMALRQLPDLARPSNPNAERQQLREVLEKALPLRKRLEEPQQMALQQTLDRLMDPWALIAYALQQRSTPVFNRAALRLEEAQRMWQRPASPSTPVTEHHLVADQQLLVDLLELMDPVFADQTHALMLVVDNWDAVAHLPDSARHALKDQLDYWLQEQVQRRINHSVPVVVCRTPVLSQTMGGSLFGQFRSRMLLAPLTASQRQRWMKGYLAQGRPWLPEDWQQAIVALSEGVPFWLEQLTFYSEGLHQLKQPGNDSKPASVEEPEPATAMAEEPLSPANQLAVATTEPEQDKDLPEEGDATLRFQGLDYHGTVPELGLSCKEDVLDILYTRVLLNVTPPEDTVARVVQTLCCQVQLHAFRVEPCLQKVAAQTGLPAATIFEVLRQLFLQRLVVPTRQDLHLTHPLNPVLMQGEGPVYQLAGRLVLDFLLEKTSFLDRHRSSSQQALVSLHQLIGLSLRTAELTPEKMEKFLALAGQLGETEAPRQLEDHLLRFWQATEQPVAVRLVALQHLALLRSPKAWDALLEACEVSSVPVLRECALQQVLPWLEESVMVRGKAASVVRPQQLWKLLPQCLQDEDTAVRRRAVYLTGWLWRAFSVDASISQDDDVQAICFQALLTQLLRCQHLSTPVEASIKVLDQARLLEALAPCLLVQRSTLQPLYLKALEHADPRVWQQAVQALIVLADNAEVFTAVSNRLHRVPEDFPAESLKSWWQQLLRMSPPGQVFQRLEAWLMAPEALESRYQSRTLLYLRLLADQPSQQAEHLLRRWVETCQRVGLDAVLQWGALRTFGQVAQLPDSVAWLEHWQPSLVQNDFIVAAYATAMQRIKARVGAAVVVSTSVTPAAPNPSNAVLPVAATALSPLDEEVAPNLHPKAAEATTPKAAEAPEAATLKDNQTSASTETSDPSSAAWQPVNEAKTEPADPEDGGTALVTAIEVVTPMAEGDKPGRGLVRWASRLLGWPQA